MHLPVREQETGMMAFLQKLIFPTVMGTEGGRDALVPLAQLVCFVRFVRFVRLVRFVRANHA